MDSLADVEKEIIKTIEARAIYLLAMREHGVKELAYKLNQKFAYFALKNLPILVDFVILKCQKNNSLSDDRYIESYVRNSLEKGQGYYKIKKALQNTTDAEDLVLSYLSLDEEVWVEMAQQVLQKKYGSEFNKNTPKEQAKKMRFLQSRGFSQSQIWQAFKEHTL